MGATRAALAAAVLLLAAASAFALRTAEWSIDPSAGLDEVELVTRLEAALAADTDLPADPRLRLGVDIALRGLDLQITSTDLDAARAVTSVVRAAPNAVMETVAAALAADLGYLRAARAGYPPATYIPPDVTDVIDGRTIAELMRTVDQARGGAAESDRGAQILDLAAHDGGVLVLLTGGLVDLGRRLEPTAATPASLLPAALPAAAAPQEIARTNWTQDMLSFDRDRARITRRRTGESSVTALDLATGARRMDAVPGGGLVTLTSDGPPSYLRLTERAIEQRLVPVAAPYITAMDVDEQRRIVLWDPYDRRVVIAGLDGREVDSMRPRVEQRMLPVVHALAVLGDGSILLGGSGLVVAFDQLGRQLWLLAAPRGGREILPVQFRLEPAAGENAFYLLDGPRSRVLRFGAAAAGAPPDEAPVAAERGAVARTLAELALAGAVAAQEWGDLTQAVERADLAVELYEHALDLAPGNTDVRRGLERAVDVYVDAESVIFQEPFLALSPERLVLRAADQPAPVDVRLQVENTGVVARTGVSLLAAGVRVPVGRIEPGERVERLVSLDLPDSVLAGWESVALDVGVVISAEEPGGAAPRRMFVSVPLRVPAPPWEQVVGRSSSARG